MKSRKKIKIGLALGSGGAKGLSHIGVIKVLEKNNISIDYVAGSSIGALVGGAYAATKDIRKIEKVVLDADLRKAFSLIDPALRSGLIGGKKVKDFIESQTKEKKIEDLLIPFSVVATDLKNGESVIIKKGDAAQAIRASISFPLVFKPIKIKKRVLGDGGLSLPVPVRVVKEMGADVVIAVNLDSNYFDRRNVREKLGFYGVASNSLNILRFHLAENNTKEADVTILPKTGNISWSKFIKGKDVIASGEKAAKRKINHLKRVIEES